MHFFRLLTFTLICVVCTAQSSLLSVVTDVATYSLLEDAYPHVPERLRVDVASLDLEFEDPLYLRTTLGSLHTTAAAAIRKGAISTLHNVIPSDVGVERLQSASIPANMLGTQAGLLNTSVARLRCQSGAPHGGKGSLQYIEYSLLGYEDVLLLAPVLTTRFGLKQVTSTFPTLLRLTFVRMCGEGPTRMDSFCEMSPDWPRGCSVVINGDDASSIDENEGAESRDLLLGFDLHPLPTSEALISAVASSGTTRVPLIVIPGLRQPISSAFQHLVRNPWYPHAHPDDIGADGLPVPDMFLETASGRMARAVKRTQRHEVFEPETEAAQMLETGAGAGASAQDSMTSNMAMFRSNERSKSANFRADRSHVHANTHEHPKHTSLSRLEELERQAEEDTNNLLAKHTEFLFAPMATVDASGEPEMLELDYSHMNSRFEHEHDEYASLWPEMAEAYPHQYSKVANNLDAALLELQSEGKQQNGNRNIFIESGETAAAHAAMQAIASVKTYLNSHIPGLKQILDPIVGNIMKPVTDQVTSSAQSQTVDAAGTEVPQGLKGQVPLDAAACLNDALTYNLTNLLTDAITSLTTTKLCKTLTEKLTPAIVESIMDTALASIHDSVVSPPSTNEAEPLDLAQKISKTLSPFLRMALRRSLVKSMVPSLTVMLTEALVPALTVSIDVVGSGEFMEAVPEDDKPVKDRLVIDELASRLAGDRLRAFELWGTKTPQEQHEAMLACEQCIGQPLHSVPTSPDATGARDATDPACIKCREKHGGYRVHLQQYYAHYFAEYYGQYMAKYFGKAVNNTDLAFLNTTVTAEQEALRKQIEASEAAVRTSSASRAQQLPPDP